MVKIIRLVSGEEICCIIPKEQVKDKSHLLRLSEPMLIKYVPQITEFGHYILAKIRHGHAVINFLVIPVIFQSPDLLLEARGHLGSPITWNHHVVVAQLRALTEEILRPALVVDLVHRSSNNLRSNINAMHCRNIVHCLADAPWHGCTVALVVYEV